MIGQSSDPRLNGAVSPILGSLPIMNGPIFGSTRIGNSNTLNEGSVYFKADNGLYLRLNTVYGGAYSSSVTVEKIVDSNSIWKIIRVGDKVSIKGSNGNYLSRCMNCWNKGLYPNSAFVHLDYNSEPYSQWTPERQGNGKWAFRSDTGKYLARCYRCASTASDVTDLAFVHQDSANNAEAQWSVEYA